MKKQKPSRSSIVECRRLKEAALREINVSPSMVRPTRYRSSMRPPVQTSEESASVRDSDQGVFNAKNLYVPAPMRLEYEANWENVHGKSKTGVVDMCIRRTAGFLVSDLYYYIVGVSSIPHTCYAPASYAERDETSYTCIFALSATHDGAPLVDRHVNITVLLNGVPQKENIWAQVESDVARGECVYQILPDASMTGGENETVHFVSGFSTVQLLAHPRVETGHRGDIEEFLRRWTPYKPPPPPPPMPVAQAYAVDAAGPYGMAPQTNIGGQDPFDQAYAQMLQQQQLQQQQLQQHRCGSR